MSFWILLQGFSLGASIIIPIGAQNAYVLNQGIQRQHHYLTAATCSLLDVIFISVGVFGGGLFLSRHPQLLTFLTVGGIGFLSFYAFGLLKSAFKTPHIESRHDVDTAYGKMTVFLGAIAVSALNPHVYLDTIVILGSIGGQFQDFERVLFATGNICASFVWFFSLSIGAARLGHILSRPKIKRTIDLTIALIMLTIAMQLLRTIIS
jgi:L-lysine exporter family protein LysE/ArgO